MPEWFGDNKVSDHLIGSTHTQTYTSSMSRDVNYFWVRTRAKYKTTRHLCSSQGARKHIL